MAHFALLDHNNRVINVIVVGDEYEETFAESQAKFGKIYVQTSYNHNIRKQFAGIGFTYDRNSDVFIAPEPFSSWSLDENFDWQPPTPMPTDGKFYLWNEETLSWVEG